MKNGGSIMSISSIRLRPVQPGESRSALVRQWRMLEVLSSTPRGATVRELADAAGTHAKTVRRDLILLRKAGFDLKASAGRFGRKSWRVGERFEGLKSPRKQYKVILETLDVLLTQVGVVGDRRLVKELEAIRGRVEKKCH